MVNSPLIRPYFLGGVALGGVPLDSHENNNEPLPTFHSSIFSLHLFSNFDPTLSHAVSVFLKEDVATKNGFPET